MDSATTADGHVLRTALRSDPELASHPALTDHTSTQPGAGLHLAVMTGPYLNRIVDGTKTVESRFHRIRNAPLNRVSAGDLVVFKPSGLAVSHVARVCDATYIDVVHTPLEVVRATWQDRIADTTDRFWSARANARWVSLIEIDWVRQTPSVVLQKRDRRGWISYDPCCLGDALF